MDEWIMGEKTNELMNRERMNKLMNGEKNKWIERGWVNRERRMDKWMNEKRI